MKIDTLREKRPRLGEEDRLTPLQKTKMKMSVMRISMIGTNKKLLMKKLRKVQGAP